MRKNSHRTDKTHGSYWRSTDRQTVRQIVLAARRYEVTMKQPGWRNGPLGSVAIEVIEDSKLGQALAGLGKNIENKRESAKQTEYQPRFPFLIE